MSIQTLRSVPSVIRNPTPILCGPGVMTQALDSAGERAHIHVPSTAPHLPFLQSRLFLREPECTGLTNGKRTEMCTNQCVFHSSTLGLCQSDSRWYRQCGRVSEGWRIISRRCRSRTRVHFFMTRLQEAPALIKLTSRTKKYSVRLLCVTNMTTRQKGPTLRLSSRVSSRRSRMEVNG